VIASVATLKGSVPGMAEVARMAGEQIEGWLRDFEGYRGVLVLTDEAGNQAMMITFWETAEAEARARAPRGAMRDQVAATAGMTVEGMRVYEVPVADVSGDPTP
jgi:heme-degrading monooxygenase HmoA